MAEVFTRHLLATDRPFTDSARIRAAVWGYGQRAVASGLAAAWWHGLVAEAPSDVEVTIPMSKSGRLHTGSYARRRDLASEDIVMRRSMLVTAVPLTVLESAIQPGRSTIMDSALQRRVGLAQLRQAHLRRRCRIREEARRDRGRRLGVPQRPCDVPA
jgi:hypothetical protein